MNPWKSIKTAPKNGKHVDLWMHIYASPRSMGMSDSFRVVDCWRTSDGKWVHADRGEVKELFADYITHWMSTPPEPRKTP